MEKGQTSRKQSFVSFGNPLLDIVVNVTPEEEDEIIERFGFLRHVGQEADTGELCQVLKDKPKQYGPGGCSLNTCRVLGWLDSENDLDIYFFGTTGDDDNCRKLEDILNRERIQERFSRHSDMVTGHCVAMVQGQERTMIASIGAAAAFSIKDFNDLNTPQYLSQAKVCYITSFFAVHSWEVTHAVAKACQKIGTCLAFNLNGEYLWQDQKFLQQLQQLLPHIKILFGNKNEFRTLIQAWQKKGISCVIMTAIENILNYQANESNGNDVNGVSNGHPSENMDIITVIISDGPDPIISCNVDKTTGHLKNWRKTMVPKMDSHEIVDTIGAGDSFVSGFLQAHYHNAATEECIDRGIYSSQAIMRNIGTKIPDFPPEKSKYTKPKTI